MQQLLFEQDRLLAFGRKVNLDRVELVSMRLRHEHNYKDIVILFVAALPMVISLLSYEYFLGHDMQLALFGSVAIGVAVVIAANLLWNPKRSTPDANEYDVFLRTKWFSIKLTKHALDYDNAEQLACAVADAVLVARNASVQKPSRPGTTVSLSHAADLSAAPEPVLAGNKIYIEDGILISAGQTLPLEGVTQIDRYQSSPKAIWRMVGISMAVFLALVVIFLLVIYLASATQSNRSPIWVWIALLAFFGLGGLATAIFIYAIVAFPAVWELMAKHQSKTVTLYKTEDSNQAQNYLRLLRNTLVAGTNREG